MERALRNPRILQVILEDEATGEPLWDSVGKLHAMCSKSSRQDELQWMFEHMAHARKSKLLTPDFSIRFLTGEGKTNGKGHCDLLLFKYRMKEYLLGDFLLTEGKDLEEKYRNTIKELFSSFEAFVEKVGYPGAPKDLAWKAGWSRAGDHALQLFEDC